MKSIVAHDRWGRLPPANSRDQPAFGWEALTKTQRTVVGHVAEGLTNVEVRHRA